VQLSLLAVRNLALGSLTLSTAKHTHLSSGASSRFSPSGGPGEPRCLQVLLFQRPQLLVCLLQKLIAIRHWVMLTNDWRLAAHLPNSTVGQSGSHTQLPVALSFVSINCLRFTLRISFSENYSLMSQNPIWDFFVKGQQDASKATCTTCGKDYSLGSDKPKLQTVTRQNTLWW